MSNVKPTNLNTAAMATQSSELRQQVNTQPQKLAIPQPRSFTRPASKPKAYAHQNLKDAQQQEQKRQRDESSLQRVVTALKQEILDLKKGQNNLQTVTELKYVKGRVASLEKSLVGRELTIAALSRENAELKGTLAEMAKRLEEVTFPPKAA